MGFFDDAAEAAAPQALPGGSLMKPIIIAAGALLLRHMLSGKKETPAPAPAPMPLPKGQPVSVDDKEVTGGLGGLLDQFRRTGLGDQVDSWVGTGDNKPVQPRELQRSIDPGTLRSIAQQLGIPEQQVLDALSQGLPGMVDKMTPRGRLPTASEVAAGFRR
jgi:uncharacterized protein YidB (DUF937 family)